MNNRGRLFYLLLFGCLPLLLSGCSEVDRSLPADSLTGEWQGLLSVPETHQQIILDIRRDEAGQLSGAITIAGNEAASGPADIIRYQGGQFYLERTRPAIFFSAQLAADESGLAGRWIRGRVGLPLTFQRSDSTRRGDITGRWRGELHVPASDIGLVLDFRKNWAGSWQPVLHSPELNARNLPVEALKRNGDSLSFEVLLIQAKYSGRLSDSSHYAGFWRWPQNDAPLPVLLNKSAADPIEYLKPPTLDDGWQTGSAEGIDSERLLEMFKAIESDRFTGVNSVVIVKDDLLIAEGYFNGCRRDMPQRLAEASHGIMALITGAALQQDLLKGGGAYVLPYLLEKYPDALIDDAAKKTISVDHLLTMTSGLACDDWKSTTLGGAAKMYRARDWTGLILDLPLSYPPGERWQHCSGAMMLLAEMLGSAAGKPFEDYAAEAFFEPLGISDVRWQVSPMGQADAAGGLLLSARDMAKVGRLLLNGGRWDDQTILEPEWVKQVFDRRRPAEGSRILSEYYGYLWWHDSYAFGADEGDTAVLFAGGDGGQFIFVFPEFRMVAVFTGSNFKSRRAALPIQLVKEYILDAML